MSSTSGLGFRRKRFFTSRPAKRSDAALCDQLLESLQVLHPVTIDYSLGRMLRLLVDMGHPERKLPPVIHVAGTNGKGSTIAIMRTLLEAAGRKVHVYTSPHLIRFNERIRLANTNGSKQVSDSELAAALQYCLDCNDNQAITFFEATTAAALHLFSSRPAMWSCSRSV